jgi:hypothetical protein
MKRSFWSAFRYILFGAVGLCSTIGANAAAIDCREPKIIPNAEVNTVMFNYSYAGRETQILDSQAGQITSLILQDSLLSQLVYRSPNTAIVELAYPDGRTPENTPICDPDEITRKLGSQVLPGHKLVFVWGNLFEDAGSIFVQSFVCIHFRQPTEGAGLDWRTSGGLYHFTAGLPTDHMAFAPHELPRQAIEQLSSFYKTLAVSREQPNAGSKQESLPDGARPFAFSFGEVREEWVSLRAFGGVPVGWVDVSKLNGQWPLRKYLPEFDFIDAAVGFLHNNERERSQGNLPLPLFTHMRDLLKDFTQNANEDWEGGALALTKWMDSIISSQQTDVNRAAPEIAYNVMGHFLRSGNPELRRHLEEVVDLAPSSPEARNQKALAELASCCIIGNPAGNPQVVLDTILDAIRLDPKNDTSLANLENLYNALRYYNGPNLSAGKATTKDKKDTPPAAVEPPPASAPNQLRERVRASLLRRSA